ncbi:MAG: sigma-70 family RNA polymerase sigma factor [Gammaproteobacteria bacterium]|uniref:RNA polymerase sigma factor n=1 Tax=Pseudomaricurvus alcaniphilus TaxID=1166482 RepID=UPI001407FB70|nr:sigma-70 family RNA polymerase sigma factor [Pseudomaricurvus alcaniphilus]MBR9912927.1 sigma-70 family RNA polymerase sigma factor [Gammaproteobacteria bacterium]NHN38666.1 sigma-70 family RNA polymerase sigma factor [Pseudomaricurvus alcaniphilus]
MSENNPEVSAIQLLRDRRLAANVLAGDERALRAFMDEYFPKLFRYARHRLDIEADVDEVVQKTLAQAARRLETYRGEATLLAWLIRICRHEISRQLAEVHRHGDMMTPYLNDEILRSVVETIELDERLQPEALNQRRELIGLIQFALDQLPEHYARALELKYIEGLNSKEIAAQMQTSDEATQSLLARARRAFREVCDVALQVVK